MSQNASLASRLSDVITLRPTAPVQRRKAPTLTKDQRLEMTKNSHETAARLEADLSAWYDSAVSYSKDLASKYGKKSDHYLRHMFSGAGKIRATRKPNAFNAWGHQLVKDAEGMSSPQYDTQTKGELIRYR